jgi:spermidine synthase
VPDGGTPAPRRPDARPSGGAQIFLERRDGGVRLYLAGDLQFDSRDEARYHEPLALVPVALAARRAPGHGLRVLVLGGGDGLALREVLRFPEVREAHLVDRDPDVLRLGRDELAPLNRDAFADPRVRVHVADAREFVGRARGFDALVSDLTYPADVAGAALFGMPFLRRVRAALAPSGVAAVNAVSPELTPQAFGCIGASLGAAGLAAIAYALELDSFHAEGYGRWGFFYASSRPIGRDELARIRMPAGAALSTAAVLAGLDLPAAARRLMRVAPNRTDELLYYLFNPTPLVWAPPWRTLRFGAVGARRGPRLTVAEGFARWLSGPVGRRSIDELLRCLPLAQRGWTREALLDWSYQAEILFRQVDLRAFVERALRRAGALPRAWVRELRALRERIRDGLPSMDELLHQAYRVFAIYLLVLLLANLLFPDNLYAKGWSSSSSSSRSSSSYSSSSSSDSLPFHGFAFTEPTARPTPFRFRQAGGAGWVPGFPRTRVYDRDGRDYPAQQVALDQPTGGPRPFPALLAVTPQLQLLESGLLAYAAAVPGYNFLLEPGRLRVLAGGRDIMALQPPPTLEAEATSQLGTQLPLLDKALADHRRWLEWTRWGSTLPAGRLAATELAELEAMRRAVEAAQQPWQKGRPGGTVTPEARWVPIFPGIHLELPAALGTDPTLILVRADGHVERRSVLPPPTLTAEDRFLFRVLHRRFTQGNDPSLAVPIRRWIDAHGAELGVAAAPTPGSRA